MSEFLIVLQQGDTFQWLSGMFKEIGYNENNIIHCKSLEECYALKNKHINLILAGVNQTNTLFPDWLELLASHFPNIPFLVIDDEKNADRAIYSLRKGAKDYLVKGSVDHERLREAIETSRSGAISTEYKRMFNETPAPMYIFDNETYEFLAVNDAALKQYGYSRKDFLKLKATDIRPVSEHEAFYKAAKVLPETYYDAGNFLHQRKNGELFYVHVFSHSTLFERRRSALVLTVDITQKVDAETALKEITSDMLDMLESITDAFYALDKKWRFTYVNKEFERIQNKRRSDFIGKRIWDVFPNSDDLQFYERYNYAVKHKKSVHFEQYLPLDNLWVSVNAYPTRSGLAVYFQDITEQKFIQEKMHTDEQNLRAIINNTADIIWSVDKDLNVITGNKLFWERVKALTGESKGSFHKSQLNTEVFNLYKDFYKRAFNNEAFKVVVNSALSAKNYEELSFNPICNKDDDVIGVNCFLRDVTEEYEYQKKIKMQNEQLREIAWLQSHKARMPVANLLGLLQLLGEPGQSDSSTEEIMGMIRETAKEVDDVIRDIAGRVNSLDS
jgi:PAS domain S-box-containing protein